MEYVSTINSWKEWNPGLDTDDLTLEELVHSMPGNKSQEISWVVKLFENPKSLFAFKGAINLTRHDALHAVLGRGLLPQDEAFVIGFTMGTSRDISVFESWIFQFITKYFYPTPYKFNDEQLKAFRMGLKKGHECPFRELYNFPFEYYTKDKVGHIRKILGLSKFFLHECYQQEKELLPHSVESQRLH